MVKLKALLLAILVLTSIILSVMIIFGESLPVRTEEEQGPWFGPRPELNQVCTPNRVYICNVSGEITQIKTFSRLYTDLILTMGQIEYGSEKSGNVWVASEYNWDSIMPGVYFRFDYLVSRELLTNWLTLFYETDFPFAFIDCIFVPLDGSPVRFINSTTGAVWERQADLPLEVFELAAAEPKNIAIYPLQELAEGANYSIRPGVFDLADQSELAVPAFSLVGQDTEEIIRSFFTNPSVIKEADGTRTYTDGYNALRVFPFGAIEFTSGAGGQEVFFGQQQLMQAALSFLHLHGGWPGVMLPVLMENTPSTPAIIEFATYSEGLPIFGDGLGIVVEFQEDHVDFLRRQLTESAQAPADKETVFPLKVHLTTETQVASFFEKGDQTITDAALAFYRDQDKLAPAWRVLTESQMLFINAKDGRIMGIRDLGGGE